jgi:hypothetical protein
MKYIAAFLLGLLLVILAVLGAQAQAAESIWLGVERTTYKVDEIVAVRVNAISAMPIQGFTFQIRYDPACLEPVNASSAIPNMNGLSLPQTVGLVDASFASTVSQAANGVLAEANFKTLTGCQTTLTLESAALAYRDAEGFAVPLPGITIGERNITLVIDDSPGESQEISPLGTPLALGPETEESEGGNNNWIGIITVAALVLMLVLVGGTIYFVYKSS